MKIFVTGPPGCGKSTLVREIVGEFGLKAGGIFTPEIREGARAGFKIIDIATGKEGILAKKGVASSARVGSYGINLSDLEEIGVRAIDRALVESDLIVIDELGAMEMKSRAFAGVIDEVMRSPKPALIVLHRAYVKEFEKFGRVLTLTKQNREQIRSEISHALRAT